jgi:hypothetical protein
LQYSDIKIKIEPERENPEVDNLIEALNGLKTKVIIEQTEVKPNSYLNVYRRLEIE